MPSLVPLDNLLGAGLIGVSISTAIWGITVLQVYLYFTEHSSRDNVYLKSFVGLVTAIDTVHVALLIAFMYHYTVTNFGDYKVLSQGTMTLWVSALVGTFVDCLVQIFFAYRVWALGSKRLIIPVLICLLSVANFGMAIGYFVTASRVTYYSNAAPDVPFGTSATALAIAADVLITTSMTYYLLKSRTDFRKTRKAVSLLITYVLNTCLLTTIFNIAQIITWFTTTQTLIYAIFFFIVVRLYSCSFVSTLNTRDHVRSELQGTNTDVVTLTNFNSSGRFNTATSVTEGSFARNEGLYKV